MLFKKILSLNSFSNLNILNRFNSTFERALGQPSHYTHPYLLEKDEVTPKLSKLQYEGRRLRLMHKLKNENERHIAIIPSNELTIMSEDIPYQFHQRTNFLYLTGFLEPDSCLLLEVEAKKDIFKSTLLVPDRDQSKELWNGPRSGTDGSSFLTGVHQTDSINNLSNILLKYLNEDYMIWCDYEDMMNMKMYYHHLRSFLDEAFKKDKCVKSLKKQIQELRLIKSSSEANLMFEACHITAEAFKQAMLTSEGGMNERTIQAIIDCECRIRGAQTLAYPPVVAGGERGNILHYINNNQRLVDGQLVLVDAGAEVNGYCADITRTWPVNGKFSAQQVKIYSIVLNVQLACIQLCIPGNNLDSIYAVMLHLLSRDLADADVFEKKLEAKEIYQIIRKYCPHHVGHWLGLDVHDTSLIARSRPLVPGMVVTIEPGLYLNQDDLKIKEEFRGIAVRIEDDILITDKDPKVLTSNCPKYPEDIEKLMNSN